MSFAHDARPGFPWVPFFPGSFAGFREPVPGPIPCTAHIFCIFLAHHSFFRQPFPGSVPAVPAAAVSLVRSSFVSSCLIFSYRCFFFCVPVFFCFSRSFLRVSRVLSFVCRSVLYAVVFQAAFAAIIPLNCPNFIFCISLQPAADSNTATCLLYETLSQLHCNPQFCAPGSRVPSHFLCRGQYGFAGQYPEFRLFPAYARRE